MNFVCPECLGTLNVGVRDNRWSRRHERQCGACLCGKLWIWRITDGVSQRRLVWDEGRDLLSPRPTIISGVFQMLTSEGKLVISVVEAGVTRTHSLVLRNRTVRLASDGLGGAPMP